MRGFFMCFSRLGDAGSGQVENRRTPRASGRVAATRAKASLRAGAAAARAKASLRAGAAAARGFRPPRGSASCSNTRARYIHVPLGRNPLAATSFAIVVFAASAGIAFCLPESASTKPRTSRWRKTRQCGDRAQAGHGWPALACWSHGWRNQAMRPIPALPRLPPKPVSSGASQTGRIQHQFGEDPQKSPLAACCQRACSLPHVGMRGHREGCVTGFARCSAKQHREVQLRRRPFREAAADATRTTRAHG